MQIEYRLSLKDYQEVNQAYLKSQRWVYFCFWFIILYSLLYSLFFITTFHIKTGPDISRIVLMVSCAILFFNPYFSNPITGYILSLYWKGLRILHHPITVEANEEMLKFKSVNYENSFQWQVFIKAIETKNIFMLCQSNIVFSWIPKRAFSSDEQVAEFRELVRTKIAKLQQV